MEKVTFQMNPSFIECLEAQWIGYWLCRNPRIYLWLTGVCLFIIAIFFTEFPRYRYIWTIVPFILLGMWLSNFFRLLHEAVISRKMYRNRDKSHISCFDEKGLSYKEKDSEGRFTWDEFIFVRETKKFFFLQSVRFSMIAICKSALEQDQIITLKQLINSSSVKEQDLLPV